MRINQLLKKLKKKLLNKPLEILTRGDRCLIVREFAGAFKSRSVWALRHEGQIAV